MVDKGVEIRAGITRYDRSAGGRPVFGGVDDPRMGTSTPGERCKTCEGRVGGEMSGVDSPMNDCPGHFGHIRLATPVYHIGFISDVQKILTCVCYHCSKLICNKSDEKYLSIIRTKDPETRLRKLFGHCKDKKTCEQVEVSSLEKYMDGISKAPSSGVHGHGGNGAWGDDEPEGFAGCGGSQPKFFRKGSRMEFDFSSAQDGFVSQRSGKVKGPLSAAEAYEIMSRITDEDATILGLDVKWVRPEWLVVSVLPVPPPAVRPSVMFGGMASQDDLTHSLTNIIKSNVTLENAIAKGEPQDIIEEYEGLLQQRVTGFFDNERADTNQDTQRSGRALKTISQRLKGKEGRIRGNLMGKRVDFSARTVISADPNLSVDQVGVPKSVAQRLTVPVHVTPFNKAELEALVKRGPEEWPGASYIIRSDMSRVHLGAMKGKNDQMLQLGWIVERHLQDDDVVLFNRQPSLHKMSIMGHRAKILDWSTFRLNLATVTPYNADFDGDEMNLHVPQAITAKADAEQLMMVPRNIVTPQSNRNVMGINQDALLGCYFMTKRDVFIDKVMAMTMMMWVASWDGNLPPPAVMKPKELWTGKQLLSIILPKINYEGNNKHAKDDKPEDKELNHCDNAVLILDGDLVHGCIEKSIIGTSGGSVVHRTWLQIGWEETVRFMNEIQTLVNCWMAQHSYTVSVSDTIADEKTMLSVNEALARAKADVNKTMSSAQRGTIKGQAGKSIMERFESTINGVLNNTRNEAGMAALANLKGRNAIKGTVDAGSKGSHNNVSQIIACVGQQNVNGKRIADGFQRRTLPHFSKDDLGMESRGFVENSYLRGLTPAEFYFHAQCGRIGCIDTAVKTAETGYIQRRLVKAMETVMARYDGTLRNSDGYVMQFLYGEDGLDGQRIEKQKFDTYKLPMNKFKDAMYIDYSGLVGLVGRDDFDYMSAEVQNDCRTRIDELQEVMDREFEQLNVDRAHLRAALATRYSPTHDPQELNDQVHLPVNMDRLIWNAQRNFKINKASPTDLHPLDVYTTVSEIAQELVLVRGEDSISQEARFNSTILFLALVRSKLSTKRVLKKLRLNKSALIWLKGEVVRIFYQAVVAPGETCGVLAAQSLGEPATQMTLNTFHSTGISAKNVTLGVPRLNEILNVAKNPKTPSLTLHLQPEVAFDETQATEVVALIEYTTLRDLMVSAEIHYDPNPMATVIEEDKGMVEEYFIIPDDDFNPANHSTFVLRIILDRPAFEMKQHLTLADISTKITEFYGNGVHIITSDELNEELLVLRVRIQFTEEDIIAARDEVDGGNQDYIFLRKVQQHLMDLHLSGIPGVTQAFTQKRKRANWTDEFGFVDAKEKLNDPSSKKEGIEEIIIETSGSNLNEAICLPQVDFARSYSNDMWEMFNTLGIEGARSSIFKELSAILSFDSGYVNVRHITCLCDCMTVGGYLMSVSRHGVNKSEVGPMLRASFEQSVEVFMTSSMFSQYDHLNGVTENVMLGQLAKVGTGLVDLLVDCEKLQGAIDYDGGLAAAAAAGADMTHALSSSSPIVTPYQPSPTGYLGSDTAYGAYTPEIGGITPMSAMYSPGGAGSSPLYAPSPGGQSPGGMSPYGGGAFGAASSPRYSPNSPIYSPQSPIYSPNSPSYSPSSQSNYSPSSPQHSPTSPQYSPTSPSFSPTSPSYSPTSN